MNRPVRPSTAAAKVAAAAAKITGANEKRRLVIEVSETTLASIRVHAANKRRSMRSYVLAFLKNDGVDGITADDVRDLAR
jgi:hypothetical protein